MPRGPDHIVHAVRDLEAAADLYRRLGFIVGGRNRHPWGTSNHIVQLPAPSPPGFYIELLGIAEPQEIAAHAPRRFSFGRHNLDFLARREGFSMLAFEGHDPQGDAAEFRAAGFGDFDVFPFEREGRRADGSPVKLAFTLAFAVDPKAPDIGFFTCHHRHPENFWDRTLQQHPNTVERLGAVVLVAENPSDHHIFLSAITGQRELQATSSGVSVSTSRGDIKVMDPAAFRSHFGVALPGTFTGARLTALQLKVRDHSALIAALQAGGVHYSSHMGATVVAPDDAMGAALVFEGA